MSPMNRDPLSRLFRRKVGVILVLGLAFFIMPLAAYKGGAAPWVALLGIGSAFCAVYIWANRL